MIAMRSVAGTTPRGFIMKSFAAGRRGSEAIGIFFA